MNKRKFKIKGPVPNQLKKELQEHREFLTALKEKNDKKLKENGFDLKLIENGLRILKAKK